MVTATYCTWVTLVAVKKMRTARGTTMIKMVRNCRARNASAPSWTALAMSFIVAVPSSAARTLRMRSSPVPMEASEATMAKDNQIRSELEKLKIW